MMKMTKREYDYKLKKIQERNKQLEMRIKLREERKKLKKAVVKGKMKTSNLVLLATIIAIILYTIACLYIQYNTAIEVSTTLTQLWFAFWTVEIAALTGIKVTKVIKGTKDKNGVMDEVSEDTEAKG